MGGTTHSGYVQFNSPNDRNGIGGKFRILRDYLQVLEFGLGDQHAIERITMVKGEFSHCEGVRRVHRKDSKAIDTSLLVQNGRKRSAQFQFSKLDLDLHFPDRDNA